MGPASFRVPEGLRAKQVEAKVPGWQGFLHRWGIWDPQMSHDDLYVRFLKLQDKMFPAAPRAQWPALYQCLAHLEQCFVVGEAMGVVHDHPFHFEVLDPAPFAQKPLHYPAGGAEWLR